MRSVHGRDFFGYRIVLLDKPCTETEVYGVRIVNTATKAGDGTHNIHRITE